MRATVTIVPQVEIVRAFTNRYVLALVAAFVLTLGLMIYFIAKALRPLRELSESCAAISAGDWRAVSTRNATGEIRALEETFNHMVASLREKALVEAKLRQAHRLSALGNLAAGVAHDVRNPLNAIKLLSSHAIDTIEDPASPAVRPLQTIRKEVDRLEEIVSSFLSLARERELAPEPHRVDDLIEECVRLFQQEAQDRRVRLLLEARAGDTRLMLDAKQWNRAILNILLNALEACPPDGRVRVFTRLTADACQIEVRDDGPGLTAESRERVFEPYYTTKPGGTGLGLAITRGIIEEHGGTIELSGAPGQGCQVLISMPLQTTKAP
jgi:signal transduction histidine kinase